MVAHEHVVSFLVKVFHTFYSIDHLHVFRKRLGKGSSAIVAKGCDGIVHLLLADESFQHTNHPCGYLLSQFRSLAGYSGFQVY